MARKNQKKEPKKESPRSGELINAKELRKFNNNRRSAADVEVPLAKMARTTESLINAEENNVITANEAHALVSRSVSIVSMFPYLYSTLRPRTRASAHVLIVRLSTCATSGRVCNICSPPQARDLIDDSVMYFERQVSNQCGKHALNIALQAGVISTWLLRVFGDHLTSLAQIDPTYALMVELSNEFYDSTGNYHVSVLESVIDQYFGKDAWAPVQLTASDGGSELLRASFISIFAQNYNAVINFPGHWFTMTRHDTLRESAGRAACPPQRAPRSTRGCATRSSS